MGSAAITWVVLKLEDAGLALLRFAGQHRRRRYDVRLAPAPPPGPPATPATPERARRAAPEPTSPAPPEHADERTRRQMAEAQQGGMSTAEGVARWVSGENPGGLHQKAPRAPEEEADRVPEHQRPEQEEPQARKDRELGGERHMAETRRGT